MNKNDLINDIKRSALHLYCLVGPNTCGKTYFLDDLFNQLENAIYFQETGEVTISDNRKMVKIENRNYFYVDDSERGTVRRIDNQPIEIDNSAMKIINYSDDVLKKIDKVHLSLGTRKLSRILNAFLSYNLNNIRYILIDEPENSLDDKNLKTVSNLLKKLIQSKFIVVLATHSPRLLEILDTDIDNIFVFSKPFESMVKHITFEEIISKFDCIGEQIDELSKERTEGLEEADKYSFLPSTILRKRYLLTILHSSEFYKTLFYNDVFIVEGLTELYLLREIRDELPVSNNYYVANGKYKIPFLIELFTELIDSVHCFFDTDIEKSNHSFSLGLTTFIVEKYSDVASLYYVDRDIESYLNMDKDNLVSELSGKTNGMAKTFKKSFIKRYKEYLCLYFVSVNSDARNAIIKLFRDSKPQDKFVIFD